MRIALADERATLQLGALLAAAVVPSSVSDAGEYGAAGKLWLRGDLGAGKTTLARGMLRALGHEGAVRSPSYTLVEHYVLAGCQVLHVDLYRLRAPQELAALGLADFDRAGTLWLVEWPEQGGAALGSPDLEVLLGFAGDGRDCELLARDARGRAWLEGLEESPVPR